MRGGKGAALQGMLQRTLSTPNAQSSGPPAQPWLQGAMRSAGRATQHRPHLPHKASPAAVKYPVCGAMVKPAMRPIIKLVKRILSTGAKSMPKNLRSGFISIVFACSSTFFSRFGAKASKSISSTSMTN